MIGSDSKEDGRRQRTDEEHKNGEGIYVYLIMGEASHLIASRTVIPACTRAS